MQSSPAETHKTNLLQKIYAGNSSSLKNLRGLLDFFIIYGRSNEGGRFDGIGCKNALLGALQDTCRIVVFIGSLGFHIALFH